MYKEYKEKTTKFGVKAFKNYIKIVFIFNFIIKH